MPCEEHDVTELGVRMSVVIGRGLQYLDCMLPGEGGI